MEELTNYTSDKRPEGYLEILSDYSDEDPLDKCKECIIVNQSIKDDEVWIPVSAIIINL